MRLCLPSIVCECPQPSFSKIRDEARNRTNFRLFIEETRNHQVPLIKKKFINKQKQNRSLKLFFSVINAKSVNLLDTSLIPRLSSSTLILATFKSPFKFTVICVTTFFFQFCFNWRNFKRAYFFIRDIRTLNLVSVRVSDPGVMSGTGAGTCVQVMRVVGETADVRGGTGRGRGRRVAFPGGEIFDVVKTGWRFDPFDHLFYSKHPNVSTSEYVLEEFFHR